jgi:hypothetical protein
MCDSVTRKTAPPGGVDLGGAWTRDVRGSGGYQISDGLDQN